MKLGIISSKEEQDKGAHKNGRGAVFWGTHVSTQQERDAEGFPGGPVAKTPCFQCDGHGLDHWSGN